MKIGIITFHNSTNYGAVLQTVALQKKLKELGYNPEIINYICRNKINMYKTFNLKNSIKGNIKELVNFPYKYIKNKKMNLFMNSEYIITKNKFYESNDIRKVKDDWDGVICGSDQIWNYENTKFDTTYMLDFIDDENKKISYAASFGINDIEKEYVPRYKELLLQIKNVSVREDQGKKIVKSITRREAEVVLDPTLLIDKKEWLKEINSINKKIKYKYILFYTLHSSEEIKELADIFKKRTGYKIIKICNSTRELLSKKYNTMIPDPYTFIELINNAEYILTDSFHGVAFSINLNKKFFVYLGKGIKNHSRITNLLNICDLNNRVIVDKNDFIIDEEINYDLVNISLEKERKKSIQFITHSVESIKKTANNDKV